MEIPDLAAKLSLVLAESGGEAGPLFGYLASGSIVRSGRPESLSITAVLVNYPSGYPGVRNFEEGLVGISAGSSAIGRFYIFAALRPKLLAMLESAAIVRFLVGFGQGGGILTLPIGDDAARLVDEALAGWAAR